MTIKDIKRYNNSIGDKKGFGCRDESNKWGLDGGDVRFCGMWII